MKGEIQWKHVLRTKSLVALAVVVFVIEVLQLILCIPLIGKAIYLFGQNDSKQAVIFIVIICGLVLFSIYNYRSFTLHLIRLMTTRYELNDSRLFISSGLFPRTSESISLDHIVEIHCIENPNPKSHTLLIVSDPPNDVKGFDFDKHQTRELASLEMIVDVDWVVKQISKLKGSPIPCKTIQKRLPAYVNNLPKHATSVFINRYVGTFYLLLSIFLLIYAIDAWHLPRKKVVDQIAHTEMIRIGKSHGGTVQTTRLGYCFGLKELLVEDKSQVTLWISQIFNSVIDVQQNGKSYRHQLTTSLKGGRVFVYFITYVMILISGIYITKRRGRVDSDSIPMVYIAPIGLLLVSFLFWNLYKC